MSMIGVPIYQSTNSNKAVAVALIDKEDRELVEQYHWCICEGVETRYARAYVKEDGKWKTSIMHRLIMDAPKGTVVHHINGNGLDNRKSNLEVQTRGEHSKFHDNLPKGD